MLFQTTNDYIVRIPDDHICVSIGAEGAEVWEVGSAADEVFVVTPDVAKTILKKLNDTEAE